MAATPSTAPTDPRILRSRRMLMDALEELLEEKSFDELSIQEIAARATVNRATFYLHYPDKGSLLQALTERRFRKLLDRRGISFNGCDGALRATALGLCDYLAETIPCASQLPSLPIDGSIIAVIENMVRQGVERHEPPAKLDAGFIAATIAGALYGAARRWLQDPHRIPAEEMALQMEQLIKPVFESA